MFSSGTVKIVTYNWVGVSSKSVFLDFKHLYVCVCLCLNKPSLTEPISAVSNGNWFFPTTLSSRDYFPSEETEN